jgi:putative spermidine/putrescine transport system permease protein
VFVLPFSLRLVIAGFSRFDFALEDAARSLGAGQARALWYITLPLVRPSLVAGFILSAILSFVNLPLSMFLTTPSTATLPVAVFAYMESRIDPLVAAVATLVVVIAAGATLFVDRVLKIRILD